MRMAASSRWPKPRQAPRQGRRHAPAAARAAAGAPAPAEHPPAAARPPLLPCRPAGRGRPHRESPPQCRCVERRGRREEKRGGSQSEGRTGGGAVAGAGSAAAMRAGTAELIAGHKCLKCYWARASWWGPGPRRLPQAVGRRKPSGRRRRQAGRPSRDGARPLLPASSALPTRSKGRQAALLTSGCRSASWGPACGLWRPRGGLTALCIACRSCTRLLTQHRLSYRAPQTQRRAAAAERPV